MKKTKKTKSPKKASATPPQKFSEPDEDASKAKFGGLDMGNFKKNMGCGS